MSIDLWERGCERLAAELPEQQYNTWIRPLPAAEVGEADGVLLVGLRVPNRFKLDWIRSQYGTRIEELLSEIAGRPVRLELSLLSRDATTRAGATVRPAPVQAINQALNPGLAAARAGLVMPAPVTPPVITPPVAVRTEPAPQAVAAADALASALPGRTTAPRRTAATRQTSQALPVQALLLPELAINPEQPPLEPPAPRRTSTTRAPSARTSAAPRTTRAPAVAAPVRPISTMATIAEPVDLPLPGQQLPEVEIAAKTPEPALIVPAAPTIIAAPTVITRSRTGGNAPASNKGRLNPLLTFENLVGGRSNQMARTAAVHVAGAPSQMYNPLYIYGGVGLGKTHLIHAVGNALIKDRPDAKVLYLHSEQFISDVVRNYQRKTFDELKAKYHTLDLLLIDDVQFFAGKDRTQEEFFTAFEALLAKRAHIIMTSDTYPKGLVDIDERLTSRFDAGLTVAIEPPELEMRVAILIRKGELEGVRVPEEVAFFIAKNVRANVRELEGALRKVLAYSRFSHKGIDIHLAREALKDLLSIQNKQISVENIQRTVADFYKIKVADMYSKKRPTNIARARQVAMYLAKEMTSKSLPQIGELFGGRDHTTVLYAVRKIAADRQKMPELNQQLHVLEQTLKS